MSPDEARGVPTTTTVIHGNALDLPLPDDSVDLIITSPPYFALRSYRDGDEHYEGQIGSEPTPQDFLEALWAATAEMKRVLKPSGSIWVNLGDKYSGSGGYNNSNIGADGRGPGRYEQSNYVGRRGDVPFVKGGIPAKSLMGLPWRYAIGCIDQLGLILRAEVVWSKPNGLPESVTDRVRRSHEQWFHFTKSPRYFSAVDEIREPHETPIHAPGNKKWAGERNDGDRMDKSWGNATLGKLPGSVWTIPSEPLIVPEHLGLPDHFAAFPQEWPRRIILGWSPSGVCTACGEGRRPVVAKEHVPSASGGIGGMSRSKARELMPVREGGLSKPGYEKKDVEATIIGYACACTPYTDHERAKLDRGRPPSPNKGQLDRAVGGRAAGRAADGWVPNTPPEPSRREYDFANWTPPPTTPAVCLDPFGGTGTVAMVARALGRTGISVDLSADYCRLAEWRIFHSGHAIKTLDRTWRDRQQEMF